MSKTIFAIALALCLTLPVGAQNTRPYERLIGGNFQKDILSFLADDSCEGRASGSLGCALAAYFISDSFREWGLKPINWSYSDSFRLNDTIVMRNIYGMVTSSCRDSSYILITAHYDHLGRIGNSIYNGADDNASGVTVLMSLARIFSAMAADGVGPARNLIFAAIDGHEWDLAGARRLVNDLESLGIRRNRIHATINMDMLGTSLEPVSSDREFIIALGEKSLPEIYRGRLRRLSQMPLYRMDLDLTFYGSRNFTPIIYGNSDLKPFIDRGIPSVLFTSGFHRHTLKPSDDTQIIDFPLLLKRTLLILNFVNALCH